MFLGPTVHTDPRVPDGVGSTLRRHPAAAAARWVPWFFLLSGFILFSAEARRPRSEPMGEYVARRAVTIYPLYAVGVLLALLVAKSRCEAPSVQALVLQAWLGQAWVPHMTEHVVQMQCWFLSCLVLYWAAFQPLFRRVSGLGLAPALGAILATLALPWLAVAVPILIGADPLWFNDHSFGHSETALDVAVVFLKFHPLCYLHVFVLGMLLGRLRLHLERFSGHRAATGLVEVMAPFGYAGLGCIFCSPALRVPVATRRGFMNLDLYARRGYVSLRLFCGMKNESDIAVYWTGVFCNL
ncbi:unnamed protein product [Prorocentrum cordatum]|uniref:Acyltransferase 3 domain-containing protein n=1 Tax=Prorocentrum cordatum TaxID=2364126 RepID=A0ABN9YFH6_9DINO|nr:unnamed protein product [Polarella glacialis]